MRSRDDDVQDLILTMNDVIFETVVTTVSASGRPHVAPMGIRYLAPPGLATPSPPPTGVQARWQSHTCSSEVEVVLMPFKPSTTLDNILATGHATLNIVVDTRVFAGCVTGRRDWPFERTQRIEGVRLAAALRHLELKLAEQQDDEQRPVLRMAVVHEADHAPFLGFNRAQSAVLEGAILVSRLHMLPAAKVDSEMAYLQIAIDKTAGPQEQEAWGWLREAVARHRAQVEGQR